MKTSKPGKKLDPQIAKFTAIIFARDKKRYERLCKWVWTQQKQGWPDEAIAKALELAGQNLDEADNWWKYLTALLPKAKAQAVEAESDSFKKADLTSVGSILRKIMAGGADANSKDL